MGLFAKEEDESPQQPLPFENLEETTSKRQLVIGGLLVAAMLLAVGGLFYYAFRPAPKAPPAPLSTPGTEASATVPAEKPAAPSPEKPAPEKPAPEKPTVPPAPHKTQPELPKAAPARPLEEKPVPPKPAPSHKAAAPHEVYFLQLAAFENPAQTAELCQAIRPLGFTCYYGTKILGGKTYYRLRVGPYEDKGKAEADLARLGKKGFEARLIPLSSAVVKPPIQLPKGKAR